MRSFFFKSLLVLVIVCGLSSFVPAGAPPPINVYQLVQKVKQPDSMSCWAAATTMLYSYKMKQYNLKIEDVLNSIKPVYLAIFKSGKGISATQEAQLYKDTKLTVIKGQNPTISYWKDLLKNRGPLSVTVNADPATNNFHALVVTGLKGDESPAGTDITYVDPADGKERTVKFTEFLKLYEGAAKWPLQIIYW